MNQSQNSEPETSRLAKWGAWVIASLAGASFSLLVLLVWGWASSLFLLEDVDQRISVYCTQQDAMPRVECATRASMEIVYGRWFIYLPFYDYEGEVQEMIDEYVANQSSGKPIH